MVAGDFLGPSLMVLGCLVIGFFIRPHWSKMDSATKFVVGLIPAMAVFSLVLLLLAALFGYDPY